MTTNQVCGSHEVNVATAGRFPLPSKVLSSQHPEIFDLHLTHQVPVLFN
jgi:hypothetical protein